MTNRRYVFLLGLSLVLGGLFSCLRDRKWPEWEVDAVLPLLETSLSIQEILVDSNCTVLPNGEVMLTFRSQLFEYGLKDMIPPFDYTLNDRFTLQTLELGDQNIVQRISLGSIASGAGIAGQLIIAANGASIPIPALPPIASSIYPIDAGAFFESLTLISGDLELTLENNLPIAIENMGYELRDDQTNAVIVSDTIPLLGPGMSATQYASLDGVSIGSQLSAWLSEINSPGSDGLPVLIDTSDALIATISITNLRPYEATAFWPAQDLINDTPDVVLTSAQDYDLYSCLIRSGDIVFDLISTIEDTIYFEFQIPEAYKQGQSYSMYKNIPPAPSNGVSIVSDIEDFSGYQLDLTGRSGTETSTFYDIVRARIDSTGLLVHLSLEDSLVFNAGIQNMIMGYAEGFLGSDTLSTDLETSPINLFQEISADLLSLGYLQIGLEVENYIGAEGQVIIDYLEAINDSTQNSVVLNTVISSNSLFIDRATHQGMGTPINPSNQILAWNSNQSNIRDLVELMPHRVKYQTTLYLNPNGSTGDLEFIDYDHPLRAYVAASIPMHFATNNMVMSDTVPFNWNGIDPESRIQSADLYLHISNGFPMSGVFDIVGLNENLRPIDVLADDWFVEPANLQSDGRVQSAWEGMQTFTLTSDRIDELRDVRFLAVRSRFDTPLDEVKVKIYSDYEIGLKAGVRANYIVNP